MVFTFIQMKITKKDILEQTADIVPMGCDYCGEAVPVIKAKKHFPMIKQWEKIWLCENCIEIIKKENARRW